MILEFSEEAEADFAEIYDYSRMSWGSVKAADYLDRLADCTEALARGELTGVLADDVRHTIRRQVVASHVIWFRKESDRVVIIRVLHQSRDAGRWISDEG